MGYSLTIITPKWENGRRELFHTELITIGDSPECEFLLTTRGPTQIPLLGSSLLGRVEHYIIGVIHYWGQLLRSGMTIDLIGQAYFPLEDG